MVNILEGKDPNSHVRAAEKALLVSGARIHLYGKSDARPGRKMGHITLLANSMDLAQARIEPLVKAVDQIRSQERVPGADSESSKSQGGKKKSPLPLVAVTMGSKSDLLVLKPGIDLLREPNVPHEVTITSAHRTPERMVRFAQEASSSGIKVIIAAAGGASHLPGMIAANTMLPVIGVPVRASVLDGLDSLLSIVQMPVSLTFLKISLIRASDHGRLTGHCCHQ